MNKCTSSFARYQNFAYPVTPCRYISAYKVQMLEKTAEGGTLAEEVFSSVRNTHAFGTQKKLTAMYDVKNSET